MRSWFMVFGVALAAACGDEKRGIGGNDTSTGSDATTTDAGTDPSDGGTTATDAASDTAQPALENACSETKVCTRGTCRSGVCVEDPPSGLEAHVTNPDGNIPTDQAPDLSCVDASPTHAVPALETATLYGAVARFGKGRTTVGIVVDVMRADSFDPTACEGLDYEDADETRACFRGLGTIIGTATAVSPPDLASTLECETHDECPLGYQCNNPADLGGECIKDFGLFEIANVPLETPLIIRSHYEGSATFDRQWHDTWIFNVTLHAHHAVDGRVHYDATMVSEGQWIIASNTVGEPKTPETHGVVGGRIRDCRGVDAENEGWPIANARIDLGNRARKIVYFNDLEDDTVPLVDRETTDAIGRFAALYVQPGWNIIGGAARVNGTVVSIGSAQVYVIPNALSIVAWPGTQPFWRQDE